MSSAQVKSLAGNAMHAISIGSIIAFTMDRTRLLPALRVMRGISSLGDFVLGFSGGSECDFDEDGLMSILSCGLVDETSRSGMTSRTSAGSVSRKRKRAAPVAIPATSAGAVRTQELQENVFIGGLEADDDME